MATALNDRVRSIPLGQVHSTGTRLAFAGQSPLVPNGTPQNPAARRIVPGALLQHYSAGQDALGTELFA